MISSFGKFFALEDVLDEFVGDQNDNFIDV